MGGKDNKSFFESLVQGLAIFLLVYALLSLIWHLISGVVDAVRYGRWDKILKVVLFFLAIWLLLKLAEKGQEKSKQSFDLQEDNRSGQEIWNENMKDYDSERGY